MLLLCEVYAVFTLVTVTVFAWLGRSYDPRTWALVGFLPGLFAPWFVDTQGFAWQVVGAGKGAEALRFSICACLLAMFIVGISVVVSWCLNWGRMDERLEVPVPENLGAGFCKAAIEELGWRCFLLPPLVQNYGLFTALLMNAVVNATFYIPVHLVIMRGIRTRDLCTAVGVSSLSNFIRSYLKSWLAIKTGYSVWASASLQLSLQRFGPVITGSIAAGVPGKVEGDLRLVAADGLAGCITLLPIVVLAFYSYG